ncbi:hypothetical protein ZOSMA_53G00480 [Zostera marina]|uniref:Dirigent protein n=1 Tax=Zostera marina TaxID=29655 RepID=A0A0K9NX64_ZOSMR|nr:hypothetical protein ZOSMA_53G00480 [Zostera marina]
MDPMVKFFSVTILLILSISSTTTISFCSAFERKSALKGVGKSTRKLLQPVEAHFQFYWHESFSGPDASSIIIAGANSTDSGDKEFGTTYAFDNPLTVDPIPPNSTSDVIGNMQGFYVLTAKEKVALAVTLNLVLKDPVFKDSILSFQGRVDTDSKMREVPIVGGTGVFRGATGYYVSQEVFSFPHSNIILFDIYACIYSHQKLTQFM